MIHILKSFAAKVWFVAVLLIVLGGTLVGATRALTLWGIGRERFLTLQVGRRRLRADILALSNEVTPRPGT